MDALVLGRKTYDIFAAYWPHHTTARRSDIARKFNEIPKYVASRGRRRSTGRARRSWGRMPSPRSPRCASKHESIHVIGSVDFVQSLLAAEAYDELTLWVYPVVLGQGKKVFPDGARPSTLTLLEPPAGVGEGRRAAALRTRG